MQQKYVTAAMDSGGESDMDQQLLSPNYLEGDITEFPLSLLQTLRRYCRVYKTFEIPCGAKTWPSGGTLKRTLAMPAPGKFATWVMPDTKEEVRVSRFSYASDRQLLVVQHGNFNHGKPSLIQWAGPGCADIQNGKLKATTTMWKVWEPFTEFDVVPQIERIIRAIPISIGKRKARSQSMEHAAPLVPKSLVVALKIASLKKARVTGPDVIDEEGILAGQYDVPDEQNYSCRASAPDVDSEEVSDTSTVPTWSQRTHVTTDTEVTEEDESNKSTSCDLDVDLTVPSPVRIIEQKDTEDFQAQPERIEFAPQSTSSNHQPSAPPPPNARDSVTQAPFVTISTATPPPRTPSRTPFNSSLKTDPEHKPPTTPTSHEVKFHFKASHTTTTPLRIRPYSQCKSVRMLFSQAVSANIAAPDTTLLLVQVANRAAGTVVKGDEEDFEKVKCDIDAELGLVENEGGLAKAEDGDVEPTAVVIVVVWPFEWDE